MRVKIDGQEYLVPELDDLTFREANLVKRLTGLRMGEYEEAFTAGDTDMLLAIAVIAKRRAGDLPDLNAEALMDTAIGAVEFIAEEGDQEAVTPPPPAAGGQADSEHEEQPEE